MSAPLVASYGPPEAVSPALLDLSLVDVPYLALGRLVEQRAVVLDYATDAVEVLEVQGGCELGR